MNSADKLVDIIYDITRQENAKRDDTVLCEVVNKIDDAHYDLYVVPDKSTIISNVVNMTRFSMSPGDYCYVYKVNNQFNNAFICYKVIVKDGDSLLYDDSTLSNSVIAALGLKEDISNKITLINSWSTDTQYPSAKSVYTALEEIRAIAQGRTATYVVTTSTAAAFASTAETISLSNNIIDKDGKTINISQLRVGDNFYVIENAYPNRWVTSVVISGSTVTVTLNRMKVDDTLVTDVKVNGTSVVTNTVANVTVPVIEANPATTTQTLTSIKINDINYSVSGGGGGSGTVTSVGTGTGLTGGPITTSGTLSIDSTVVALKTDLTDKEDTSNKVMSITSASTNTEYPSAKAVWDLPTTYSGYSASATQTLQNVNGTLTWITNVPGISYEEVE